MTPVWLLWCVCVLDFLDSHQLSYFALEKKRKVCLALAFGPQAWLSLCIHLHLDSAFEFRSISA